MSPDQELRAVAKQLRDPIQCLPLELSQRLADWLEHCADEIASTRRTLDRVGRRPGYTDLEELDEPDSVRHALAVARAINPTPKETSP